jgi:hypothetical protein
VLAKLAKLHLPEIIEATLENQAAAWACGVYVSIDNGQETVGGEDLAIVYRGLHRAADTNTRRERPLPEHVKACVSRVFQEAVNDQVASLRRLKARGVLKKLLSLPPLPADSLAHTWRGGAIR